MTAHGTITPTNTHDTERRPPRSVPLPPPGLAPTTDRLVTLSGPTRGAWDAYVHCRAEGTLFHTSAWHDAVSRAFPHRAYYVLCERHGRTVGVLPLFLVKSWLGGRMLVSVPYGVGGGVIADDADAEVALIQRAKKIAGDEGCCVLDLRSARAVMSDQAVNDRYVTFERELPERSELVLGWLPRKARAAARNGRAKFGLTTDWNPCRLRDVWRLYTVSMRRLGSLSYPWTFFEALLDEFGSSAWVSTVLFDNKPVGGLLSFVHRDRVMPYFFGASSAAKHYSVANYAYLTLMERAVDAGVRIFDFGRSRRDNTGSYEFKRLHGFTPKALEYQQFVPPGRTRPNLSPSNPRYRTVRRVWAYLPLAVTRTVGAVVARHIPG